MKHIISIILLFIGLAAYSQSGVRPSQIQGSPYKKGILQATGKYYDHARRDTFYTYAHVPLDSLGFAIPDSTNQRGTVLRVSDSLFYKQCPSCSYSFVTKIDTSNTNEFQTLIMPGNSTVTLSNGGGTMSFNGISGITVDDFGGAFFIAADDPSPTNELGSIRRSGDSLFYTRSDVYSEQFITKIDTSNVNEYGNVSISNDSIFYQACPTCPIEFKFELPDAPTPDGSETIVTEGTGIDVTGTGTVGDPYVVEWARPYMYSTSDFSAQLGRDTLALEFYENRTMTDGRNEKIPITDNCWFNEKNLGWLQNRIIEKTSRVDIAFFGDSRSETYETYELNIIKPLIRQYGFGGSGYVRYANTTGYNFTFTGDWSGAGDYTPANASGARISLQNYGSKNSSGDICIVKGVDNEYGTGRADSVIFEYTNQPSGGSFTYEVGYMKGTDTKVLYSGSVSTNGTTELKYLSFEIGANMIPYAKIEVTSGTVESSGFYFVNKKGVCVHNYAKSGSRASYLINDTRSDVYAANAARIGYDAVISNFGTNDADPSNHAEYLDSVINIYKSKLSFEKSFLIMSVVPRGTSVADYGRQIWSENLLLAKKHDIAAFDLQCMMGDNVADSLLADDGTHEYNAIRERIGKEISSKLVPSVEVLEDKSYTLQYDYDANIFIFPTGVDKIVHCYPVEKSPLTTYQYDITYEGVTHFGTSAYSYHTIASLHYRDGTTKVNYSAVSGNILLGGDTVAIEVTPLYVQNDSICFDSYFSSAISESQGRLFEKVTMNNYISKISAHNALKNGIRKRLTTSLPSRNTTIPFRFLLSNTDVSISVRADTSKWKYAGGYIQPKQNLPVKVQGTSIDLYNASDQFGVGMNMNSSTPTININPSSTFNQSQMVLNGAAGTSRLFTNAGGIYFDIAAILQFRKYTTSAATLRLEDDGDLTFYNNAGSSKGTWDNSGLNVGGTLSVTGLSGTPYTLGAWTIGNQATEVTLGTNLSWSGTTLNASDQYVGTLTSVGLSMPSIFSVSGSPVTSSGTLTATLASQSANLVFASPNGGAGTPTFRSLAIADLPTLSTSNLSDWPSPTGHGGKYLTTDGTNYSWASISAADTSLWKYAGGYLVNKAINPIKLYGANTDFFDASNMKYLSVHNGSATATFDLNPSNSSSQSIYYMRNSTQYMRLFLNNSNFFFDFPSAAQFRSSITSQSALRLEDDGDMTFYNNAGSSKGSWSNSTLNVTGDVVISSQLQVGTLTATPNAIGAYSAAGYSTKLKTGIGLAISNDSLKLSAYTSNLIDFPSQTGNSGKYIGTNGTALSFSTPNGNFGQIASHSAYTDFNTAQSLWGWNYVAGSTNGPNSTSSQWYRGKFGLGSEYPAYFLEVAYPRYNHATAQQWMRTVENNTPGSWTRLGADIINSGTGISVSGSGSNASPYVITNTGVTSIATNNGITGGTITTSGTIGLTGQALALHNLASNGIISRTGSGTVAARTITAGTGISISNGDGVSGNPTITNTGDTNAADDMLLFNGSSSADYNTLTTNGIYRATGATNGPSGAAHSTMFTAMQSGNYGWQLAGIGNDAFYMRWENGGSWGSWSQLASRSWASANFLTSEVDGSTSNELQSISTSGAAGNITLSNGGGTLNLNVNDADASTTNEIQTISKSGNTVSLSLSGGSFNIANDTPADGEVLTWSSGNWIASAAASGANIYNSDGTIPSSTFREVMISAGSDLYFTDPSNGLNFQLNDHLLAAQINDGSGNYSTHVMTTSYNRLGFDTDNFINFNENGATLSLNGSTGTSGYVLKSGGAGTMYWEAATGGGTDTSKWKYAGGYIQPDQNLPLKIQGSSIDYFNASNQAALSINANSSTPTIDLNPSNTFSQSIFYLRNSTGYMRLFLNNSSHFYDFPGALQYRNSATSAATLRLEDDGDMTFYNNAGTSKGTWGNAGLSVDGTFSSTGQNQLSHLSGSGTRMVTATATGVLGAATIPEITSFTTSGNSITIIEAGVSRGVTAPNLYTVNGSLAGNRTVTMGTNSLTFTGTNNVTTITPSGSFPTFQNVVSGSGVDYYMVNTATEGGGFQAYNTAASGVYLQASDTYAGHLIGSYSGGTNFKGGIINSTEVVQAWLDSRVEVDASGVKIEINGSTGTAGDALLSGGSGTMTYGKPVGTQVNNYSSSNTWTKPTGCKTVTVIVIGGGGGGGGGSYIDNSTHNSGSGGGGGGAGGRSQETLDCASISGTVSITVGSGGSGGSAQSSLPANGNTGSPGNQSSFGSYLKANGGGGGQGGQLSATSTGGSAGLGSSCDGGMGGGSNNTATSGTTGEAARFASGGGNGGAGVTTSSGGSNTTSTSPALGTTGSVTLLGSGGTGAAAANPGGSAGIYGGGGGGGGAGRSATHIQGGAGGSGAGGYVQVITNF